MFPARISAFINHEESTMNHVTFCRWRKVLRYVLLAGLLGIASGLVLAQPKYRTFSQDELALKKVKKLGKRIATIATFTFVNDSTYPVNSLHAKFNSEILEILD